MRPACLAAFLALFFNTSSHAIETHAIHGLFCNTEADIDQALSLLAEQVRPQSVTEMLNEKSVACVFADRLRYMVHAPLIIGEPPNGYSLIKYRASLIGVVVGNDVRPVSPPTPIYFLVPERLEGAETAGGA